MDKYAIIVAGGSGTRMGSDLPKQFIILQGKPVLCYAIDAFYHAYHNIKIVLVLPHMYMELGSSIIQSQPWRENISITAGGESRFHSVKNGLSLVPGDSLVFIHDAVRCLLTPRLIQNCYETAIQKGNAIPAVSPVDSVRLAHENGNRVIDRSAVRLVQTPQTFLSTNLKKAFQQEYRMSFTDEASVVESMGGEIHLIQGEITNIKLTTPSDLFFAEKILQDRNTA